MLLPSRRSLRLLRGPCGGLAAAALLLSACTDCRRGPTVPADPALPPASQPVPAPADAPPPAVDPGLDADAMLSLVPDHALLVRLHLRPLPADPRALQTHAAIVHWLLTEEVLKRTTDPGLLASAPAVETALRLDAPWVSGMDRDGTSFVAVQRQPGVPDAEAIVALAAWYGQETVTGVTDVPGGLVRGLQASYRATDRVIWAADRAEWLTSRSGAPGVPPAGRFLFSPDPTDVLRSWSGTDPDDEAGQAPFGIFRGMEWSLRMDGDGPPSIEAALHFVAGAPLLTWWASEGTVPPPLVDDVWLSGSAALSQAGIAALRSPELASGLEEAGVPLARLLASADPAQGARLWGVLRAGAEGDWPLLDGWCDLGTDVAALDTLQQTRTWLREVGVAPVRSGSGFRVRWMDRAITLLQEDARLHLHAGPVSGSPPLAPTGPSAGGPALQLVFQPAPALRLARSPAGDLLADSMATCGARIRMEGGPTPSALRLRISWEAASGPACDSALTDALPRYMQLRRERLTR